MESQSRFGAINISSIRVDGIGGLGLVAMAAVVSVFFPAIGWMMAAGILGGIVLAIGLVVAHRHLAPKGPSGTDPAILFRAVPPEGGNYREPEKRSRSVDRELLTANG